MSKKNTIILFALSVLFFSLSLVGVYVYGQTTSVYHPAEEIIAGTFQSGIYAFGEGSSVAVKKPGTSTGTVQIGSPGGNPGIVFTSNDPNYYRADIERTTSGLSFDVHAATTNPLSVMFLSNNGNVGIGTTSPSQKLHVSGNILGSNLSTAGSVTGAIFYDNNNTNYYVDPAGTTSAILNGNVGIGTTSPSQKLHVVGNAHVTGYVRMDGNPAVLVGTSQVSIDGANFRNFVLRTIDTGSQPEVNDFVATHSKVINTVMIKNSYYGGSVRIHLGAGVTGNDRSQTVSPPSGCLNGAFVCIRDANGNDTAALGVHTIYATTKNFLINHPLKPRMKLVHASIEGPENAVYYRGESRLKNGKAVVKLPEYFEALLVKRGELFC